MDIVERYGPLHHKHGISFSQVRYSPSPHVRTRDIGHISCLAIAKVQHFGPEVGMRWNQRSSPIERAGSDAVADGHGNCALLHRGRRRDLTGPAVAVVEPRALEAVVQADPTVYGDERDVATSRLAIRRTEIEEGTVMDRMALCRSRGGFENARSVVWSLWKAAFHGEVDVVCRRSE